MAFIARCNMTKLPAHVGCIAGGGDPNRVLGGEHYAEPFDVRVKFNGETTVFTMVTTLCKVA